MSSNTSHLNLSLTWEDISNYSKMLANKLAAKGEWQGVIAVTTGGMIPACIVARHLGIKHIDTFCVSSYDDQTKRHAKIIKQPEIADGGAGWLVIDDLSDKGDTLRLIRKYLPNAHYGTIYAKPTGEDAVDTFVVNIDSNVWLHFPWEDNEKSYLAPTATATKPQP